MWAQGQVMLVPGRGCYDGSMSSLSHRILLGSLGGLPFLWVMGARMSGWQAVLFPSVYLATTMLLAVTVHVLERAFERFDCE